MSPPAALDRTAAPVMLEVTGATEVGDITRTTASGAVTESDERLPFRLTIPVPATGPVTLSASAIPDEDQPPGPVYCTIIQADRLLVSHGLDTRVSCSAR